MSNLIQFKIPPKDPKEPVSFSCPGSLIDKVDELSRFFNINRSEFIRHIIEERIKTIEEQYSIKKKKSC